MYGERCARAHLGGDLLFGGLLGFGGGYFLTFTLPLWSSRFNFSCWSFDRGDPIDNRYRTCLDVLLFICYFNGWWFRCLVGADDVFGDGGGGRLWYDEFVLRGHRYGLPTRLPVIHFGFRLARLSRQPGSFELFPYP